MSASKSRSFRHRVEIFQLFRFFSGFYTVEGAFRLSSSDDLKLRLIPESFKRAQAYLSTAGHFGGG